MKKATRWDELEDLVGTLGQTFLGLSIQCARCHDHKFDPISQKEYYQVAALFGGVNQEEKERRNIKLQTKGSAEILRRRACPDPPTAARLHSPGPRRLPEASRGGRSLGVEIAPGSSR